MRNERGHCNSPRCQQSSQKDTLSGQLSKMQEFESQPPPRRPFLFLLFLSVCFFLSSPRHSSNRKLFCQFSKALWGQERSTDSTLPTLYAWQLMGATNEKDLFGKGGGRGGKLLGAMAEAGQTLQQISEPAATKGIKQLLFPVESKGGRGTEETDRDGNTGSLLQT